MTDINQSLGDYIHNIDKLRNLVRYQTAARVSSESVAEHSFFVASYIIKLHEIYEFNLEEALITAILHDFSEVFISDVPHPIKEAYPDIAKSLEKAEFDINEKYLNKDIASWLEDFNNLSTAEGVIIALADIISVVTYAKYEIGLGNSKYMRKVLENARERYCYVINQAEKYLREGKTSVDVFSGIEQIIK